MNENIIKEYESRKSLAVKIEATESLQERNKLKQEYRKLFNNINYLDRKTLQKRKRKGEKIENNDNYDTMEKIDDILKQINLKQEHTIEVDEKYNNNNEKSYQYPYEKEKNPIKRILQAGLYWIIKHPFLTAMAITGKLLPKTNAVKQSKQINDVQTIYNDFVQKHPNADFNDEFCLNDFLQDHFNNINDYLKNHNILLLRSRRRCHTARPGGNLVSDSGICVERPAAAIRKITGSVEACIRNDLARCGEFVGALGSADIFTGLDIDTPVLAVDIINPFLQLQVILPQPLPGMCFHQRHVQRPCQHHH